MKISTINQDNLIRWSAAAVTYFICLIAFYIDIGQDMGAKYFVPIMIPMLLALTLIPCGTHVPIFSRAALPNLLTGLGWCVTFPLLYQWTYDSMWYPSKICFDFIVGTAAFVLLMSVEAALFRIFSPKAAAVIMAALNFLGLVIPFIQAAYYCMVWHCLSPASLMALYLTNYRESIDFIQSNVGLVPLLLILAGFGLFLYGCCRGHLAFGRRTLAEDATAGRMGVLVLLTASAIAAEAWYLPQTSAADLWTMLQATSARRRNTARDTTNALTA